MRKELKVWILLVIAQIILWNSGENIAAVCHVFSVQYLLPLFLVTLYGIWSKEYLLTFLIGIISWYIFSFSITRYASDPFEWIHLGNISIVLCSLGFIYGIFGVFIVYLDKNVKLYKT